MKNPIFFILILLFILFYALPLVSADVIPPGMKTINYYYQLNTQDYPDYIFLLYGSPNPQLAIINSSTFSFYKLNTVHIYAITRNNYNLAQLDQMNNSQLDLFLKNDPLVSRSPLELKGSYGTVSDSDPLESVLMVVKIGSINNNQLDLVKERVVYTYSNGQTEEKPFTDQNQTPAPSGYASSNPPFGYASSNQYAYYILIPILGLLAILIIAWKRRTRN